MFSVITVMEPIIILWSRPMLTQFMTVTSVGNHVRFDGHGVVNFILEWTTSLDSLGL